LIPTYSPGEKRKQSREAEETPLNKNRGGLLGEEPELRGSVGNIVRKQELNSIKKTKITRPEGRRKVGGARKKRNQKKLNSGKLH